MRAKTSIPAGRGFFRPLAGLLLIFLFSTTTTARSSSYQMLDRDGIGYSEEETGPARFEIHYSGEWRQPPETVAKYALFRSAELAEEMGFPFFIIESMTLFDEPNVQIFETCSEIRILSDATVPASNISVRYLMETEEQQGVFAAAQITKMASLLLEDKGPFPLSSFLEQRGVIISD